MKCKVKGFNGTIYPVDYVGGRYLVIMPTEGILIYTVTQFESIFEIVEEVKDEK